MSGTRVRTTEVLLFLGTRRSELLEELRSEGLFQSDELEPREAEDLRFAVGLMEEFDVNAAGVAVALHLRGRLRALTLRTRTLVDWIESDSRIRSDRED